MNPLVSRLAIIILAVSFLAYIVPIIDTGYRWQGVDRAVSQAKRGQTFRDGYKCVEFSKRLLGELEKQGIGANMVIVKRPHDIHALVGIWVDAQSGELVTTFPYLGDEADTIKADGKTWLQ
jgi:hypothetical protein